MDENECNLHIARQTHGIFERPRGKVLPTGKVVEGHDVLDNAYRIVFFFHQSILKVVRQKKPPAT
jgi:hypothetical protein